MLSLKWISNYLNDRTQRLSSKNSFSSLIRVTSGVPLESHLGPLLYALFINDLRQALTMSRVLMHADNVKLYQQYNELA